MNKNSLTNEEKLMVFEAALNTDEGRVALAEAK